MSLKNEKRYVYRTSLDFLQNICWLFILTYILSSCVFNPSVLLSKYIFQLLPHLCQKMSVNSRCKLKVIVDPKIKQINFLDLPFQFFLSCTLGKYWQFIYHEKIVTTGNNVLSRTYVIDFYNFVQTNSFDT